MWEFRPLMRTAKAQEMPHIYIVCVYVCMYVGMCVCMYIYVFVSKLFMCIFF